MWPSVHSMQPKRYFRHLNNTFDGNFQGIHCVVDCRRSCTLCERVSECACTSMYCVIHLWCAHQSHGQQQQLWWWLRRWWWRRRRRPIHLTHRMGRKHTVAEAPAVIEAINYVSQIPNRVEYLRIISHMYVYALCRQASGASIRTKMNEKPRKKDRLLVKVFNLQCSPRKNK